MESVLEKKRKATVGRICRKGRFKPGKKTAGVIDTRSYKVAHYKIRPRK